MARLFCTFQGGNFWLWGLFSFTPGPELQDFRWPFCTGPSRSLEVSWWWQAHWGWCIFQGRILGFSFATQWWRCWFPSLRISGRFCSWIFAQRSRIYRRPFARAIWERGMVYPFQFSSTISLWAAWRQSQGRFPPTVKPPLCWPRSGRTEVSVVLWGSAWWRSRGRGAGICWGTARRSHSRCLRSC